MLVTALMAFAFAGCGSSYKPGTDDLPKSASDPEVVKKWDEYSKLDGLPRYTGAGIFDNIYVGEDGMVVVSFKAVSADDFESYAQSYLSNGFELEEGSSIWVTNGMSGVPQFKKGNASVTLVWTMNGDLDVGAE